MKTMKKKLKKVSTIEDVNMVYRFELKDFERRLKKLELRFAK